MARVAPSSGADTWYRIKVHLVAQAGWTVRASSNGTTHSMSSDLWTSNAAVTASSWIVLRAPGGTREICIQRGTNDYQARIKYTFASTFAAGSPSATRVPATASASDETLIFGTGTDASPGYQSVFNSTANYYLLGVAYTDVDYDFWFAAYPTGGGDPTGGFCWSSITRGSRASADTDPYVFYPRHPSNLTFKNATISDTDGGPGGPVGWTGSGFATYPAQLMATRLEADTFPINVAQGQYAVDPLVPILLARQATGTNGSSIGAKGIATLFAWTGVSRSTGDTYTVNSTRDYILMGDVVLPWGGAAVGTDRSARFLFTSSDPTAPTISGVSPTSGANLAATAADARYQAISFTVADTSPGLRNVVVTARYGNDRRTFVVHDGTSFVAPFDGFSTRTGTAASYAYSIRPDGGWPGAPTIAIDAVDQAGNRTSSSYTWTMPSGTFTEADSVKTQIEDTIKAISVSGQPFKLGMYSEDLQDQSVPSGLERAFHVWHGPWKLGEYHHTGESSVIEDFMVVLVYPEKRDWRDRDNQIRNDVHAIRVALETSSSWTTSTITQRVIEGAAPEHMDEEDRWIAAFTVQVEFLEPST